MQFCEVYYGLNYGEWKLRSRFRQVEGGDIHKLNRHNGDEPPENLDSILFNQSIVRHRKL